MIDPAAPPSPVNAAGEPVDWTEAGPVSPRFGDVYFSAVDGLEETRAVYLQGCGLPDAWAGRRRFVVAELGFGTGLNILALLQLWVRHRPSPDARLHLFSVEGFPLSPQDAGLAFDRWPELSDLTEPLRSRWPRGRRGRHRFEWPELGATLDLAIDEALPALEGWDGRADAWFLDGFAPARNPQMWSEPVLAAVAQRCAPGARLASFTVAGAVRRGLQAHGLDVERRPGFGRKKQRLEARAPGEAAPEHTAPSVAVIGAGIAGAALARALRLQGCAVSVIEVDAPGAGASGNAAALVTPRLDAGGGPVAQLHAQAFARAVALYADEPPGAVIATGAVQLQRTDKDAARFPRIAAFDGFDRGSLTPLPAAAAAVRLDEAGAPEALLLAQALVVEPKAVLAAWLTGAEAITARVATPQPAEGRVRLCDAAGRVIIETDAVVVTSGADTAMLLPNLALRPVRGQASEADLPFTGAPAAWGGYAIPTRSGVLYGASHRPGDAAVDLRAEEAQANLQRLAEGRPQLAQRAAALPAEARRERAAVRATLADHLPAAGAVSGGADGVYVLGGLGGRGFALAPLLAEHVAALIVGAPSPLPLALQALVSPDRRQARTGGNAAAQEPSQEPAVPSQPAPPVATPREP